MRTNQICGFAKRSCTHAIILQHEIYCVQLVAAIEAQLELVQDAMRQRRGAHNLDTNSATQPVHSESTNATAQAAAEEAACR